MNTPEDSSKDMPKSPIRPQEPSGHEGRVLPSFPKPSTPKSLVEPDPTPTEQIDIILPPAEQANEALDRLRQKMRAVAEEYAQGKINRAQFDAIYHRYQEQREITEMLLARNPSSAAWQSVVSPGHTGFLRQHFEARVESYAIYHINQQQQIVRNGYVQIPDAQITPILERLSAMLAQEGVPVLAKRHLDNKRLALFIPGQYSLSVVIFSTEPALAQIEMVRDIHHDFERANAQMLLSQRYNIKGMVFPHRALFEL